MARGRKPGFTMTEEHRVKIQNSNILNALVEHVEGRREMSSTQVSAGLGLLRKVLPDLSSTEVSGKDGKDLLPKPSPREVARIVVGLLRKAADEDESGDRASGD